MQHAMTRSHLPFSCREKYRGSREKENEKEKERDVVSNPGPPNETLQSRGYDRYAMAPLCYSVQTTELFG